METTLLQQSNDWRERRRLRAWELYQQGWKQKDIAAKLDATEGAVSQWIARAKTEGADGLRKRSSPGRPARLSWEQKARIPHLLLRGAQAWGFAGDVWTCARIAQVIAREYDVTYHPDTIGDLLKACGWSYQKPVCRATQRKEEAIQEWKQERLPALKKGAEAGRYKLLFVDESAFYLLPGVVRTWGPMGHTPLLAHKLTRDHLSVISAISAEGELFLQMRSTAFDSEGIVTFLKELLLQIEGAIVVVWDGAPIHRSKVIQQFLAEGAAARLHLERLPGYAPEVNPDEGIWHYLKHVELRNVCCEDMTRLQHELTKAEQRLRAKPDIIQACFRQTGYFSS